MYQSLADTRGFTLEFESQEENVQVYIDRNKAEKIFNNLLSNAFKYTPRGGRIEVHVTLIPSAPEPLPFVHGVREDGGENQSGDGGHGHVEVTVSDTGIGIPPEHVPHIFNRFYQVDDSTTREQQGTGIGLALVKELVEMHHGAIRVASEPGKGTEFVVGLPLGMKHLRSDEIIMGGDEQEREMSTEQLVQEDLALDDQVVKGAQPHSRRPIILVIDDNADVRFYIRDTLPSAYEVIEAGDGAEGICLAQEAIPDLIISDIMIPKKDGYEVCRVLKNDQRTSHIPLILLTAKAASENRIAGLETGADDYLVKPFEPDELVARVDNLIESRRRLRERFGMGGVLKPGEVVITSIDDAFLQRAIALVDEHMGNARFGAEQLAEVVGLSRMQLHRKLTALTDQTAGELIRNMRLHRAMALLRENAGTVSEIAFRVGFSDSSYFAKRFRDQFGMTPGKARETSPLKAGSARPPSA
jgi:DNA-binding response OmpR family regulator